MRGFWQVYSASGCSRATHAPKGRRQCQWPQEYIYISIYICIDEIFSPVPAVSGIFMILNLATQFDTLTDHVDIPQTFVQGELLPGDGHNGKVYIFAPPGYDQNFLFCVLPPQTTLQYAICSKRLILAYYNERLPRKGRMCNSDGHWEEHVNLHNSPSWSSHPPRCVMISSSHAPTGRYLTLSTHTFWMHSKASMRAPAPCSTTSVMRWPQGCAHWQILFWHILNSVTMCTFQERITCLPLNTFGLTYVAVKIKRFATFVTLMKPVTFFGAEWILIGPVILAPVIAHGIRHNAERWPFFLKESAPR